MGGGGQAFGNYIQIQLDSIHGGCTLARLVDKVSDDCKKMYGFMESNCGVSFCINY